MKMVRGLVRQQEDATRVLGERLRNEAREHVRCLSFSCLYGPEQKRLQKIQN